MWYMVSLYTFGNLLPSGIELSSYSAFRNHVPSGLFCQTTPFPISGKSWIKDTAHTAHTHTHPFVIYVTFLCTLSFTCRSGVNGARKWFDSESKSQFIQRWNSRIYVISETWLNAVVIVSAVAEHLTNNPIRFVESVAVSSLLYIAARCVRVFRKIKALTADGNRITFVMIKLRTSRPVYLSTRWCISHPTSTLCLSRVHSQNIQLCELCIRSTINSALNNFAFSII